MTASTLKINACQVRPESLPAAGDSPVEDYLVAALCGVVAVLLGNLVMNVLTPVNYLPIVSLMVALLTIPTVFNLTGVALLTAGLPFSTQNRQVVCGLVASILPAFCLIANVAVYSAIHIGLVVVKVG